MSRSSVTSVTDALVTVTNATQKSILDVAGVVDFPVSLLGEFFQKYL